MSKQLARIGLVAGMTMVSRVLGLIRDILTAAVFGTTALASAFFTAFTLPNLFRRLLGEGALTAAFVPTLNEELARRQRAGAFELVSQVASWLLVVTVGVVAVSMAALGGGWWEGAASALGAEPGTIARWRLGAELAVWLFPYMVFVCLAAAFSAALQTLERFLEPALSPIWLNLAMIAALVGGAWGGWATDGDTRIRLLCAGVLVGGFFQMAVPAAALMREGWRPRLDLRRSAQVRAIVGLMAPTVVGSAVYLINLSLVRFVGLSLNDAAVTLLNMATRLMELPIGVFAVAVSTVVFPLISRHAAQGDWPAFGASYRRGMRLILVVNVPAAAGLVLLAEPIIRLLFQRGAFHAQDTGAMVPVLAVFAAGLPFFSFVNLVLRAFYARKDTRTPVRAAVLSFIVNIGLGFALMGPLSTVGLALASNLAVVAQAWYLQARLARSDDGLAFHHLWRDLLKILAGVVAMAAVVEAGLLVARWWMPATRVRDIVILATAIPLGVAAYGAALWLLRIEGREELPALGARLLSRFGLRRIR
ncbi:MAG: murein biosynthesis integral membrane protein MurJ [Opitutaceae bacterium]